MLCHFLINAEALTNWPALSWGAFWGHSNAVSTILLSRRTPLPQESRMPALLIDLWGIRWGQRSCYAMQKSISTYKQLDNGWGADRTWPTSSAWSWRAYLAKAQSPGNWFNTIWTRAAQLRLSSFCIHLTICLLSSSDFIRLSLLNLFRSTFSIKVSAFIEFSIMSKLSRTELAWCSLLINRPKWAGKSQ